ncbi:MAG: AI-2E family transporter [Acidimicrobiia bacterium]
MEETSVSAPSPRARLFGAGSDGMPAWLPRFMRQIAVFLLVGWALLNIVRALRGFLILLLISVFLAIALEPGVAFLAHRGWRRGIATGVIFVLFGLLAALFIALMVPLIVDQTRLFVQNIPAYVEDASDVLGRLGIDVSSTRVDDALTSVDSSLQSIAADVAGSVFGVGTRLLNTVFSLLTIMLFTFYLTADAPRLRRAVLSTLPEARQREVIRVFEIAIDKTGGYFYSRALLAAVATVVSWLVLTIIGVDFALPLAIWVGVLSQFVPVFGTYLGGILPVLIALLESPGMALAVLVFIALYQQFENYVISPRITARTMSLHPAIAFGSAIVGATLLGAAGALMALPVAATIQAFVATYLHRHELIDHEFVDAAAAAPSADGADAGEHAAT